jgi:4-methyl-5(b-hydroxyethyl)-thiazole monophosphate biosynthesis
MPKALVPLAEGCEELEAVSVIDILRRGKVEVVAAGLKEGVVRASRGTRLLPDATLDEALQQEFDLIVLPGGLPGADNLAADTRLTERLRKQAESGKLVAAICASPKVLAQEGLLNGRRCTAFPGSVDWSQVSGHENTGSPLEQDGNIITSRGPGTAMDFALHLVEVLQGRVVREQVESGLVRP